MTVARRAADRRGRSPRRCRRWRGCASPCSATGPTSTTARSTTSRRTWPSSPPRAAPSSSPPTTATTIVGCATAAPLAEVEGEFAAPFRGARLSTSPASSTAANPCCCRPIAAGAWATPSSTSARRRPARSAALRTRRSAPWCAPTTIRCGPQDYVPLDAFWAQARLRQGRRPRRPLRLEGHRPAGRDGEAHAVLDEGAVMATLEDRRRAVSARGLRHPRRLSRQARALGGGGGRRRRAAAGVSRVRCDGVCRRAGRRGRRRSRGVARRRVADALAEMDAAHAELARRHGVHILAASGPVARGRRPLRQCGAAVRARPARSASRRS